MKPTIGRIVRYYKNVTEPGEPVKLVPLAALISEVNDPQNETSAIGIHVFDVTRSYIVRNVPHGSGAAGTWSWPERSS